MIIHILSDFSRVLLFPQDKSYSDGLNDLYRTKVQQENSAYFAIFQLNEELLSFFESLKPHYPLSIFTSEIIQNDPAVRPRLESIFSNIFSAQDLGVRKTEAGAYLRIVAELQEDPAHILYIDDNEKNVEAARAAGLQVVHYSSNQQTITEIEELLATKEKEAL